MKKFILFFLLVIFCNSVNALEWFIDCNKGNDSVTIADSKQFNISMNTALASPYHLFTGGWLAAGDTIYFNQGTYRRSEMGELAITKANIGIIGKGEVIFQGLGKSIATLNNMFAFNQNGISLKNIKFIDFYYVMSLTGSPFTAKEISFCFFENNHSIIFSNVNSYLNLKNCMFNRNVYFFYSTNGLNVYNVNNCSFYNTLNTVMYATGGIIYNNFINCLYDSNALVHNSILSAPLNCYKNNFTRSAPSFGSDTTSYQPDFIDTANNIFYLKPTSQLMNAATDGKQIGAYANAKVSYKQDTNTWSEWRSFITDNDSISLYSDSQLRVDTNGVTLLRGADYVKERHIIKVDDMEGKRSYTISVSNSSIENWTVDVDSNAKSCITFDTSIPYRNFRYKFSDTAFSKEDILPSAENWFLGYFKEPLSVTGKYFARCYTLRNNVQK